MARTVVLGEQHDDDGLWARSVTLDDGGDLLIEGHDLGPGVERLLGAGLREYEFVRTVRAADVPAVVRALGLAEGADILDALDVRYAGQGTHEIEKLIESAAITSELWGRVGD